MKVKEYLVNRILELEKELKQTRNEKAGTVFGLQKLQEDVIKLNEKIEQYQIEREHIKEIIACNISDKEIKIFYPQADYTSLLAILDIKPEDYEKPHIEHECPECKHEAKSPSEYPCDSCVNGCYFESKEVTTDAETKD